MQQSRPLDACYDPVYTTKATPFAQSGRRVVKVSGANFFQRPMVPHLDVVSPTILLAPPAAQKSYSRLEIKEEEQTAAAARDVGIQTVFRESEAQTDPYSPEYLQQQQQQQKDESLVLLLEGLTYRDGRLPVGTKEIEMIGHAKAKHRLVSSLPPATDEASLSLRKRLLELQEVREFELRRKELDDANEARVEALRQALEARDQEADFLVDQRVEAMRQRKIEIRDASIDDIQARRIKVLRKLAAARGRIPRDYGGYASRVYAPIAREGRRPDKKSADYDVKRLVDALPIDRVSLPKPPRPKPPPKPPREKSQLAADLLKMATLIENDVETTTTTTRKKKILLVQKNEKPPTPRVPKRENEDRDLALKLLQKLLRGRAVQNQVFQGKQRRSELIRELRAADAVKEEEEEEEEELNQDNKPSEDETRTLETIAGETASAVLDLCAKELERRELKDRVATLAKRADAERRRLEAQEAGTRQAEEIVRDRNDHVYRQVMKAHLETARSYVDEIVDLALDECARRQALRDLRNNPKLRAELDAARDAYVDDLVASFLAPALQHLQHKKATESAEAHVTYAAQDAIINAVLEEEEEEEAP
ncbi:hypothetical protein CTAYLR_004264 [Chrysophaeum taylorii]|uniref:Cilia- and flagella-associated protein 91 n=1 Tax=Chrysophaeum taylorii TaxID=2483200 RepID=A0AAD7UE31_9STRA|nr:hypothetical protein CTAYLR_004264 [Chrysophaeum taylorii]